MLNFLRKLRRNNLNAKYFKYAIGEIFLVVIGILIALQVNNWNQERLNKKKAKSYHERIIEDLDIFINETGEQINRSAWARKLILQTIGMLEAKELPEDKIRIFERTLHLYYQVPYRNPSISTITEMRSNGELELMDNLDLRKKLIQFEQEILSADEIFVLMGHHAAEQVFYIDQYIRSFPDTSLVSTDYLEIRIKANFKEMADDPKLLNYLSKFSVQWSHHMMFTRDLNESAVKLRDELVDELEKLN
ncbi:hypothetical protein E4S40_15410 [Algoriphagus kandeliae]|uniref:Uncharacterized protein n=1 Tax=Algoriphagus kandeliae TaxID=2562278 RepID=A0A4Y9QLS2_9BACT|nr:hypothetical protein [Algoriphagus kandeliae]TFV93629.1 hypothetical protein E4S40_15410 [Algoriphagus kandeliae]